MKNGFGNKVYRAFLPVLLFLLVWNAVALRARADVIGGPTDGDDFYWDHRDETVSLYVFCHVKTETPGFDAPGDSVPVVSLKPGESTLVCEAWQDANGVWWVLAEDGLEAPSGHGGYMSGSWFPLERMYLTGDDGKEISALSLVGAGPDAANLPASGRLRSTIAGIPVVVVIIVLAVLFVLWLLAVILVIRRHRRGR